MFRMRSIIIALALALGGCQTLKDFGNWALAPLCPGIPLPETPPENEPAPETVKVASAKNACVAKPATGE